MVSKQAIWLILKGALRGSTAAQDKGDKNSCATIQYGKEAWASWMGGKEEWPQLFRNRRIFGNFNAS